MNKIIPQLNGPLHITGQIEVENDQGQVLIESKELFLCRCGQSRNKPFCDGSHNKGFSHDGEFIDEKPQELQAQSGPLRITVKSNAMLVCNGPLRIESPSGSCYTTRQKAALCRCGQSKKKPFCDIAHKANGFSAD